MQNIDWDIFRIILAVAEGGSAFAAAEKLSVNPSTVLRRIDKFEQTHGLRLFERRQTGYTPTLDCEALLETARSMEQGVSSIAVPLLGSDLRLEGSVSFTTTDTFLETVLPSHLEAFATQHPKIQLEVAVTNNRLNLTQHDADVALRPSLKPPETLIGQKVSKLSFGIYANGDWAEKIKGTDDDFELSDLPWITTGEQLAGSPAHNWISEYIDAASIVMSVDTFPAMRNLVVSGVGVAVLPCCLGQLHPQLHRIDVPLERLDINVWLLTHQGFRNSARVRAFIDFIAPRLRAARPLLEGRVISD